MKRLPTDMKINTYYATILLYNVLLAVKDTQVGFNDADRTLDQLIEGLNKPVYLDKTLLESCLYYANMMEELGLFFHPRGSNFDTTVSRILPENLTFNKFLNLIEVKGESNAQ